MNCGKCLYWRHNPKLQQDGSMRGNKFGVCMVSPPMVQLIMRETLAGKAEPGQLNVRPFTGNDDMCSKFSRYAPEGS